MRHYLNCRECADLLLDYLEGNLDDDTRRKLDEHFSACPPCVNFLKTYQACSEMATKLRDQEVQIPAELEHRLQSFLKAQLGKA